MADGIKWTVAIRVTSLSTSESRVSATRTETVGEDVTTESFTVAAKWEDGASKADFLTGVFDTIWQVYQTRVVKNATVEAFVADCESLLADALDAKELE